MVSDKSNKTRWTWKPIAAGVAAALTGIGSTAIAQDAPEEEVIVTGTRIRQQDPLRAQGPVIIVSEEAIAKTGLTAIADVLYQLPVSGGAINTKFNSSGNFGFPPDGGGIGAGAALADLRYLGPKRTLVLVNGKRWVSESSASGVSSVVDLNTIPINIVQRIEVLADGAAPVYGSDAIAGVVNIITKDEFEGVELRGYTGAYDEGDGENQEFTASIGTSGERSHSFLNFTYVNQDEVLARDREISAFPTPGLGQCTSNCSSGTPQGRFFFNWPGLDGIPGNADDFAINQTNNDGTPGPTPMFDPFAADPNNAGDFHEFTTADRFNFSQFNLVLTPSTRVSVYGEGHWDFNDNIGFFMRGMFNSRESTNQAAPEPLFIGPNAGNGNLLDTITVDTTNPFNPYGDSNLGAGNGITLGDGDPTFFGGRRPIEAGPRIFNQNVDTWYASGGLQGEFGEERTYYWDFVGIWSQNRADQIKQGAFNSNKLKSALGPAGVDASGNVVCGPADPGTGVVPDELIVPGCTPFNFFGGQGANGEGTITQAMLDYVGFVQKDVSEQELVDWQFNIGGDIVQLPGGMLAFAAGLEHREQDGFFQPDAVVVAGDSAGVPSSPTAGGFKVDELYAEFQIPILAGVTAAQFLEVSLAARYSDYDTFGDDTKGKFGLRWRPITDLLFRGTFAEGFRAPGIGESFGSQSRFDQTIVDLCSDMLGIQDPANTQPQNIVNNCVALGVPADGSYQQFNQQISVTTGGNPALKPEESETLTVGAVYDASWAEGAAWADRFAIELNYYDIEVDGAIQAINAKDQLDGCINTLDATLCDGISRTVTGVINGFANQLTNIGGIKTNGYDVNLYWTSPLYNVGQFAVAWQNSFINEYTEEVFTSTGFADIPREGTEIGDPENAFPEWKSFFSVDWTGGDWAARLGIRHIDELLESCEGLGEFTDQLCSDPVGQTNVMDATTFVDLQGSWLPGNFDGRLIVSLGVNNVLDEEPPFCFSCALNGFDATQYDVPGQFWYLRAGYTFALQ